MGERHMLTASSVAKATHPHLLANLHQESESTVNQQSKSAALCSKIASPTGRRELCWKRLPCHAQNW
jgi:hypothetical protein